MVVKHMHVSGEGDAPTSSLVPGRMPVAATTHPDAANAIERMIRLAFLHVLVIAFSFFDGPSRIFLGARAGELQVVGSGFGLDDGAQHS